MSQPARRFHIALSVADIEQSVVDYSRRFGAEPTVVVPGEYALWLAETLNFAIRKTADRPGTLRHVGWEDVSAPGFDVQQDINGLSWEYFNSTAQVEEIQRMWPDSARTLEHLKRW